MTSYITSYLNACAITTSYLTGSSPVSGFVTSVPHHCKQGSLCRVIVPLADRLCKLLEVSTVLLVRRDSRAIDNGIILLIISFSYNICLQVTLCWLVACYVRLILFTSSRYITIILSANSVAAL